MKTRKSYLETVQRTRRHLRRRDRDQPAAARAQRPRLRRRGARGLQRDAVPHPSRRRPGAAPLLPRGRRRRRRDELVRVVAHRARRVPDRGPRRGARPAPRPSLAKEVASGYSTPDRPRFVAGSMGPGTKLPTLGQVSFADLRDAYEVLARGPARRRRRPAPDRDLLRPPPGQGGHPGVPAGDDARPGARCRSRCR